MNTHGSVALTSGAADILIRLLGDLNFQWETSVTPAIISGVIVGGCTLVGGLLGGRFGYAIGGGIGSFINSNYSAQIRSLSEMLQQLAMDQLRALYSLLRREIINTLTIGLQISLNGLSRLEDLLEFFGNLPEVQSLIIDTITNYFRGIHGNNLRLVHA